jgi:DNA-directed RNA polymerase subunit RPC12/RpoP
MSEFKFNCPRCDQHLKCDEAFSGREIQCPTCNHLIRIPAIPGKTANYVAESGQTWNTFIQPGVPHRPPPGPAKPKKEPPAGG